MQRIYGRDCFTKAFTQLKDNNKEWYKIQGLVTVERRPAPGLSK